MPAASQVRIMFWTSRKSMPVNIMSIMIQSRPRKAHNSTVSGSFAHTPSAVRPDFMHSSIGFLGDIGPFLFIVVGWRSRVVNEGCLLEHVAPRAEGRFEQDGEREADRCLEKGERGEAREVTDVPDF